MEYSFGGVVFFSSGRTEVMERSFSSNDAAVCMTESYSAVMLRHTAFQPFCTSSRTVATNW